MAAGDGPRVRDRHLSVPCYAAMDGGSQAGETGQIEGLYTLRRGVTEQLIAEGFAGVRAVHAAARTTIATATAA